MAEENKAADPDDMAFLQVPVGCIGIVEKALRDAGKAEAANHVSRYGRHYLDPDANAERERWVGLADEEHGKDGDIEFDPSTTISDSEGGQYVLGWVWVYEPEGDEDEEEDEEAKDD